MEADSRIVLPQDVLSPTSFLYVLTAIPCLSSTFHCSCVDAEVSAVSVCEIMLSCGQEVKSMCDSSQAKIQDSVSEL